MGVCLSPPLMTTLQCGRDLRKTLHRAGPSQAHGPPGTRVACGPNGDPSALAKPLCGAATGRNHSPQDQSHQSFLNKALTAGHWSC